MSDQVGQVGPRQGTFEQQPKPGSVGARDNISHTHAWEMEGPEAERAYAGTPFVWDLLRFAWLAVAATAAACLWRELARPAVERNDVSCG